MEYQSLIEIEAEALQQEIIMLKSSLESAETRLKHLQLICVHDYKEIGNNHNDTVLKCCHCGKTKTI